MHKMTWPKVNDDHGILMKMMMLMICMWKDATIHWGVTEKEGINPPKVLKRGDVTGERAASRAATHPATQLLGCWRSPWSGRAPASSSTPPRDHTLRQPPFSLSRSTTVSSRRQPNSPHSLPLRPNWTHPHLRHPLANPGHAQESLFTVPNAQATSFLFNSGQRPPGIKQC